MRFAVLCIIVLMAGMIYVVLIEPYIESRRFYYEIGVKYVFRTLSDDIHTGDIDLHSFDGIIPLDDFLRNSHREELRDYLDLSDQRYDQMRFVFDCPRYVIIAPSPISSTINSELLPLTSDNLERMKYSSYCITNGISSSGDILVYGEVDNCT